MKHLIGGLVVAGAVVVASVVVIALDSRGKLDFARPTRS